MINFYKTQFNIVSMMKHSRLLFLILCCYLCVACTAQFHRVPDTTGEKKHVVVKFQRQNTAPQTGVVLVKPMDLQSGDILFSAESNLNSRISRLFGNTSVSHAFLYLGDGEIAEAVGSGVHIMSLAESIDESQLLAVYRHPHLNNLHAEKIREFAMAEAGGKYNYLGILKQTPYTFTRKVCELPVTPRAFRHLCLNTMALVQVTPFSSDRYFCSQLVVAAYDYAGLPLTKTPAEWVAPGDLLHMRDDDIPSVVPVYPLQYVGHLRCKTSLWQRSCTLADI
jgi:uncharacterized protein YycO